MMEIFRQMTNDCIRIGLQNDASTMKRLSKLAYKQTGKYNIVNYYRLCAISHAAGILANRKKSLKEIEPSGIEGVDRNLHNLTVGNTEKVMQYDISKAASVVENTRSIMKSFRRNDVRIRRKLYGKYGQRRKNRVKQLLHHVSKVVVQQAKETKSAIAFEDIRKIRQLYQRGNHQGSTYRSKMNSWSFAEIKHLITYKAAWEGVSVIQLSKSETFGTSQLCPRCGKKITQVDRKTRQVWCDECKRWMDRDVVGAMNVSIKGLARFASSQGLAGEAVKGNPDMPVILRVDASKLAFRRKLKS